MTRYLIIKEEPCTECNGTGVKRHALADGVKYTTLCRHCEGGGCLCTEIDLRQALVELGMVTDGK